MELFELVLLLLAAVLASSVIDQLVPRVSLPLIQIAIGVVVVLVVPGHMNFVMNSELFLVLLIAPLLFDESRNADTRALWQNKGSILSLAIGLVLALVLSVGFVLHWLEPSIPLAAAFALGAALGPTDAVAVASLSKEVALSNRQKAQLSGEALINDASGVVSFQFAIAAATTGAFSLADASASFLVSFGGGIGLGLVLGAIALACTRLIRQRGIESVTTHVTFEIFTPFIVFMIAESIGVSGILAVVAAGLLLSFAPAPVNSLTTRLSLASSSVWEILVFVANGVVFVMLGMELPHAILPGWNDREMNNSLIIMASLVLTLVLIVVRFVWVFVMDVAARDEQTGKRGQRPTLKMARDSLVTTLAGPKGAVTLSIAFTIPAMVTSGEEFPFRDTLICIASVTILLTLLAANFVMPAIAPKRDDSAERAEREEYVRILQQVTNELRAHITPRNAQAMQVVLHAYDARLEQLRGPQVSSARLRHLSEQVLARQRELVEQAVEEGTTTEVTGQRCVDQIARMSRLLERHQGGRTKRFNPVISVKLALRGLVDQLRATGKSEAAKQAQRDELELIVRLEQCALDYLEPLTKQGWGRSEVAAAAEVLVREHKATMASLETRLNADPDSTIAMQPIDGLRAHTERTLEAANNLYAQALRLELDEIQTAREAGRITKTTAQELREEVYLLQMGLNEHRG